MTKLREKQNRHANSAVKLAPVLARRPGPLVRLTRFARRHWKVGTAVLLTAAVLLAIAPRLFDKSVEDLLNWASEQHAAGQHEAALRTYARAYRKATASERRQILDLILTCAPYLKDPNQMGEAVQDVLAVDPDISFQEYDFAVAKAWKSRQDARVHMPSLEPDGKRHLLEIGEK